MDSNVFRTSDEFTNPELSQLEPPEQSTAETVSPGQAEDDLEDQEGSQDESILRDQSEENLENLDIAGHESQLDPDFNAENLDEASNYEHEDLDETLQMSGLPMIAQNYGDNEDSILRRDVSAAETEMEQDIIEFNQAQKERRRGTLFDNPRYISTILGSFEIMNGLDSCLRKII